MRLLLTLLLVSLIAVPVMAGPPATGIFAPIDGRFSESWNPTEGQIGNTLNAASWNGSVLGGQWLLSCPAIFAVPTLQSDERDVDGTGDVVWATTYVGGTYMFSKNGPWGDGTEDYAGTVTFTNVVSTHQYFMGTRIAVRSNVTVKGEFTLYGGCFVYTLSNVAILGVGALPADHPEYINSSCVAWGTGAYGSVTDISLIIYDRTSTECTIPVRETTWGHVKSLYAD
jgi:hypothetical protein